MGLRRYLYFGLSRVPYLVSVDTSYRKICVLCLPMCASCLQRLEEDNGTGHLIYSYYLNFWWTWFSHSMHNPRPISPFFPNWKLPRAACYFEIIFTSFLWLKIFRMHKKGGGPKVTARGRLAGAHLLQALCGSAGINPDPQSWRQQLVLAKPSLCPSKYLVFVLTW